MVAQPNTKQYICNLLAFDKYQNPYSLHSYDYTESWMTRLKKLNVQIFLINFSYCICQNPRGENALNFISKVVFMCYKPFYARISQAEWSFSVTLLSLHCSSVIYKMSEKTYLNESKELQDKQNYYSQTDKPNLRFISTQRIKNLYPSFHN